MAERVNKRPRWQQWSKELDDEFVQEADKLAQNLKGGGKSICVYRADPSCPAFAQSTFEIREGDESLPDAMTYASVFNSKGNKPAHILIVLMELLGIPIEPDDYQTMADKLDVPVHTYANGWKRDDLKLYSSCTPNKKY